MVEIVSWVSVAIIALFAAVGFAGVLATTALTVVRSVQHRDASSDAAEAPRYASAA